MSESLLGQLQLRAAFAISGADRHYAVPFDSDLDRAAIAKIEQLQGLVNHHHSRASGLADEVVALCTRIEALEAENARLRDCLTGIEEYWNGGNESAVDAAEEMRDRASAALAGKAGQ